MDRKIDILKIAKEDAADVVTAIKTEELNKLRSKLVNAIYINDKYAIFDSLLLIAKAANAEIKIIPYLLDAFDANKKYVTAFAMLLSTK